ncbi:glypican-5-like [Gadus chalcogrammus]|uniref:glypican-5-like n=1 Tax=Gadus chalcogrammus TaxID=1042646 RepID=UPI0024C497C9|nr:glypican-5-like [Gadus chalcogrammus]
MALIGKINCVLVLACCAALTFGDPTTCDEVRKVFQLKQIGPVKLVPSSPRTASGLQVCVSRNHTCCTRKMEERYQLSARQDLLTLLHTTSSSLRLLLSRHLNAFQESFEVLMKQAENRTNALLRESYASMAAGSADAMREFFTDVGLFLLGSELSPDASLQRLLDGLFPSVYGHLIDPGLGDIDSGYAECVRSTRRELRPFGASPGILANQMARSGTTAKLLLQALHLGIEVINTTDHLQLSRECRHALLKMHYCPHCQGLTQSQPCMGYCLNVMRGCLASVAEIDPLWRDFVRSLEGLSARMQGPQDLEQVLLGAPMLLHDAVAYAQGNAPYLAAQVHRLCGPQIRTPGQSASSWKPISTPAKERGDTLAGRRKDFLSSLRQWRAYYGGLADQFCVRELASADSLSCWNGADVVRSYTMRVVGNGIKAQSDNPEVKVKGADPVISQIIDKLKHVNQLLQGKSIPRLGSLDHIETGSGDREGRASGDCDDEDGCSGSGGGEGRRTFPRIAKLAPDVDGTLRGVPQPDSEDHGPESSGTSTHAGRSAPVLALILTGLHILLVFKQTP